MGGARSRIVEVSVLGESYQIRTSGSASDERRLMAAADLLSKRMDAICGATRELSALRLAVMAGLDMATEVISEREAHERDLADEASFRRSVEERSDRLLGLVRTEIEERVATASLPAALSKVRGRG